MTHQLPSFFRHICCSFVVATIVATTPNIVSAINKESAHFETIMGIDELPNLSANAIYQDQYGIIWVGTNDGLVSYDGDNYKTYKYSSTNPHSISSKRITAIAEGPDGTLWLNTYDGLNRFNRQTDDFTHFLLHDKLGNSLTPGGTRIHFDSQGKIIIGSIAGLPIFDPKTETWDQTFTEKGEFVKGIHSLGKDEFLIASHSGYHHLDLSTGALKLLKESPLNQSGIPIPGRCVFKDSQDRLWLGSLGEGCFVFDSQGNAIEFPPLEDDTILNDLGIIRFITEDRMGNVWVGSNQNGLLVLPKGASQLLIFDYDIHHSHSLPADRIQAVAMLQDDQLLFGSADSGVIRFDPHRQEFEYYTRNSPLTKHLYVSPVRFIAKGRNDQVWLNDSSRSLSRFDLDTKDVKSWSISSSPLSSIRDNIQSIAVDAQNRMFLSTESKGLFKVDLNAQKSEPLKFNAVGFNPRNINLKAQLDFDSFGTLWIMGNFILKYEEDTNTIRSIGDPSKLRGNNFSAKMVYENQEGDLWFGSIARGVFFYSRKEDTITEFYDYQLNPDLLKDVRVTGIFQQSDEYLWVTTQSGIGRLNLKTKQFENPDYLTPILDTPMFGLEHDTEGTLWALTAQGLIRINIKNESIQHYSEKDGLYAAGFSEKPIKRVRDDVIIVGGQNGMNVFNPQKIGLRPHPPKVNISGITVQSPLGPEYPFSLDAPAYMTESFTLPCSNNSFTINFASISPGNERGIEYAYMLEGLENEWNYLTDTSHATFTTVKDGEYVFKVKARNRGLPWSDEITQISVIVLAPYYLKTWFHVSMGLLVISLIYAFVRYRTYKIKSANKRLARQVFARTKDLEESRNEAIEARRSAEKADKAKSTFLATVSHEIRTPMNGVLGMSKLLHKTNLNNEQKTYVGAINESGSSLLNIINDILDFSKMEAGKFRIHCHDVNIREEIDSIVALYRPEATSRNLEINTEVHPSVPTIVSADGYRLRQVIINLLNNGIKFTEEGTIKISVNTTPPNSLSGLQSIEAHEDSASCVGDCDLRLYFSVTDTGIGIAPEDQQKLFQSFSQVEDFEDREFGGTGIGLAISKKLVNLMGGEIQVESQKGKGSTFTFSIFSRDLDNESDTTESCCENTESVSSVTYSDNQEEARILVTDDNEINRVVAEGLIKSLGYQVESSPSGADTLERVKKRAFDLILMDVQMPGVDGLEATRLIKKELPEEQQPVIVAMTADSRDEIDKVCLDAGMQAVLQKPITEEKLLELFQQYGLVALQN